MELCWPDLVALHIVLLLIWFYFGAMDYIYKEGSGRMDYNFPGRSEIIVRSGVRQVA